ncbi:MAG: hypothetical protein ACE5GE_09875 [Phycisphaerae bacterium]
MNDRRDSTPFGLRCRARWIRPTAAAVLLTWLPSFFVAVARAEQVASPPEAPKPWLQWLLVLAFAGLCCGIAFKNPKRSHMD